MKLVLLVCLVFLVCGVSAVGINCTGPVDCSFHGVCFNSTACYCDDRYATFQCGATECCYKRKSRLTTFLLAFFLAEFGANRFYLGETANGLGFLFYTLSPFIVLCCIIFPTAFFLGKDLDSNPCFQMAGTCCLFVWLLGFFCWWLYEIIASGKGDLLDWNGIATANDM